MKLTRSSDLGVQVGGRILRRNEVLRGHVSTAGTRVCLCRVHECEHNGCRVHAVTVLCTWSRSTRRSTIPTAPGECSRVHRRATGVRQAAMDEVATVPSLDWVVLAVAFCFGDCQPKAFGEVVRDQFPESPHQVFVGAIEAVRRQQLVKFHSVQTT
jgi:hypothetical protein